MQEGKDRHQVDWLIPCMMSMEVERVKSGMRMGMGIGEWRMELGVDAIARAR